MTVIAHHLDSVPKNRKHVWRLLSRYKDTHFVSEIIIERNNLKDSQRSNAKKQAKQIRYCLVQAQEYFEAAETTTLATRPLLLYYGVMSLAIAEYLFKQDGRVSLDVARSSHNHHGLTIHIDSSVKTSRTIGKICEKIVSRPHIINGKRRGTFELWHRSARPYPTVGMLTLADERGFNTNSSRVLAIPEDERMVLLPSNGIDLLDCLTNLPFLRQTLAVIGAPLKCPRAKVSLQYNKVSRTNEYEIIIHPYIKQYIDKTIESIKVTPRLTNRIKVFEFASGIGMRVTVEDGVEAERASFPNSTQMNLDEVFLYPGNPPLNEFGYIYASLYMLGNFCRYYPDYWMIHLERSSDLCIVSENLLDEAMIRAPMLLVSELSGRFHVH